MLERASVCPAAMVTLLWLRDLEVTHWLEDTERDVNCERGFKEYRQVLPLMQRIHVVNHATNYTSMVAREILRWKKESPAMIKAIGWRVRLSFPESGLLEGFVSDWLHGIRRCDLPDLFRGI